MLIYDLPFRTRRLGNGVCRSTLGSSSTRQGPCANDKFCFSQKWIERTYLLSIHQEIIWSLGRRTTCKRMDRVIRGRDNCQMALVRLGKPRRSVTSKEHPLESGRIITSGREGNQMTAGDLAVGGRCLGNSWLVLLLAMYIK